MGLIDMGVGPHYANVHKHDVVDVEEVFEHLRRSAGSYPENHDVLVVCTANEWCVQPSVDSSTYQ